MTISKNVFIFFIVVSFITNTSYGKYGGGGGGFLFFFKKTSPVYHYTGLGK
jgi:hypothetical protein